MSRKRDVHFESTSDNEEKDLKKHRREMYRDIATNRASHFARADTVAEKPSKASSTPMGLVTTRLNVDDNDWCGAFSTAQVMINKRDKIKREREEMLKNAELGNVVNELPDHADDYDRFIFDLKWTPIGNNRKFNNNRGTVPSLVDICIDFLIENIASIESLDGIDNESRSLLGTKLGALNKIDSLAVQTLATYGCEAFIIPECSKLDELDLLLGIKSIAVSNIGEEVVTSPINTISLRNCGHGFTTKLAQDALPYLNALEVLEVTGLYRLDSDALCSILESSKETLKSLDFSCNNRLHSSVMTTMLSMRSLQSIKLDHCIHLCDEDISVLAKPDSSLQLTSISLENLFNITGASICSVIKAHGATLTSINASGCHKLDDELLQAIKENCSKISSLSIARLHDISTAGLIGCFLTHDDNNNSIRSIGPLAHVNLQGVTGVTDDVIIQVALTGTTYLRELCINSCTEVTSKALAALYFHNKSLRSLDMSFVRTIDEKALGHFVDNTPTLKELSLWGCSQITKTFYYGHTNHNLKILGQV
jgi:DNA repair protein RAD7